MSVSLSLASAVLNDTKTVLMWQDNTATKNIKKDWQGALALCDALNLESHDDWRLPNIKELENIINKEFKNVSDSGYYWSSSAHESSEEFAWMMNFKRGFKYNNYKTYERYVRCVRDK